MDALRLGCVAIGYTIYPGTAERRLQYEQLQALTRAGEGAWAGGRRLGVPARQRRQ